MTQCPLEYIIVFNPFEKEHEVVTERGIASYAQNKLTVWLRYRVAHRSCNTTARAIVIVIQNVVNKTTELNISTIYPIYLLIYLVFVSHFHECIYTKNTKI